MNILNNVTKICSLSEYDSVLQFILDTCIVSKAKLKKFKLSKKFLNRKVMNRQEIELPLDLVNFNMVNPVFDGNNIEVLYEDDDFIAINKPHDIHTHPLSYTESDNCLSYLRENNSDVLLVNSESYDRGILFRLDYVTSGVVICSKKNDLYNQIRDNFNTLAKTKKYIAVVYGDFKLSGKFKHYFRATGTKGYKVQVSEEEIESSISGIFFANKLSYNPDSDTSLVEITLKTGLRHQIRSQLSFLGYPIVGDVLYGGRKDLRVFLHAHTYEIQINSRSLKVTSNNAFLFDQFFDLNSCL